MKKTKPTKHKRRLRAVFYLLLIGILGLLLLNPVQIHYQSLVNKSTHYEAGTVVAIVSQELSDSDLGSGQSLGVQHLQVSLHSGEIVELNNYLTDTHNILAQPGMRVIVCADIPEGVAPHYTLYNYDRSAAIAGIALFFVLLMVAIGGRKGFDSSLAILFTLLLLLRFAVPVIYNGGNPFAVGILTVLASATVTISLLYGFTVRGILAITVTLLGTGLACLLFVIFIYLLHVTGFQSDNAESLLVVTQNTGLQLRYVLLAATMISALGAVMDVAVSLLSALWEIKQTKPDMSSAMLLRSGMNIGRDMIGTMSNTLIFAFAGGALTTMLVLFSYGVQLNQLVSSDYVALELAQGLSGTMAVILTVPLASISAAAVFTRIKNPGKKPVHIH